MNLLPIPTREQGNPLYPLPPDYAELSTEGQRQSRVNACRQWLISNKRIPSLLSLPDSTPFTEVDSLVKRYRAEAKVASLNFFDLYYLHPDPDTGFEPMFYDMDPLLTPEFHWDITRACAVESAVLAVAPRGSAKSSHLRKDVSLCLLSRPINKELYCTSSDKVAAETAQIVRQQVYTNSRIQDDWSKEPEFGGRIKPSRGDAPTGIEGFALTNGSSFETYSVSSRIRGKRPRKFRLDDPEYDPSASTSMAIIREYMRRLLFKIALPMVMRRESGIEWLATFVSKRHFAYMAMQLRELFEEGQKVFRAEIPEFDYWHRLLIRAAHSTPEGQLVSCWPEMWPVNEAEKEALKLPKETKTLEEIKLRIGTANFNSEYMAQPGDASETFFGELSPSRHGYTFTEVDPLIESLPCRSGTFICWNTHTRDGEQERKMPLFQFCGSHARLLMTVDTSKTHNADSDFKVATVMAITPENDLFILDTFGARCTPDRFIKEIFKLADRWKVPVIDPELIDDGKILAGQLLNIVATRAIEQLGITHIPAIRGFNPGQTSKTAKISGLSLRFEHNKIKLPISQRTSPKWRRLFDQIEGFNPDADDGGLQNDDDLDTVSMSQFIVKGRITPRHADKAKSSDALQLLLEGETHDETGIPLAYYLDFSTLTQEDFSKVTDAIRVRQATSDSKV